MRLLAVYHHLEPVRTRHGRAWAHAHLADVERTNHVHAEHRVGLEVGEHAFFQHQRCAALFAGRRAFLRGLEHEHHFARQVLFHAGEHGREAQQHGRVSIVAAGVHHARNLRAIRHVVFFLQRQCVHVGAQRHDRRAASQMTDDARLADAGFNTQPQSAQHICHERCCVSLGKAHFGVLVNGSSPLDKLVLN